MYYFLADFNRKINLSHITKATTPFGVMREGVKRSRDALTDLAKLGGKKREGAYLVNNSGKLSKYTTDGEKYVVNPFKLTGNKSNNNVRAVLHNHPVNASLSVGDFLGSSKAKQIINTTPNGSYYRGYLKNPDSFGAEKRMKNTDRMITSLAEDVVREYKPNTNTLNSKNFDRLSFIIGHIRNKSLANQGLVHYRAKLTPKDKRTLDFWLQKSPKLKSIYDGG